MQTSQISKRFNVRFGCAAVAGLFALTTTAMLPAQQTPSNRSSAMPETIDFLAEAKAPVDLAAPTDGSYSSSAEPTSAVAAERLTLLSPEASSTDLQPPPRRRYGRPRYQDRGHNPDGSNRYTFEFGGGMTVPTGATGKRTTLSYSLKGGAGINFNKKLGVMAEYNYDHFGISGSTLANQAALFNNLYGSITDGAGNTTNFDGLDGNAHVWSLTVNPMYTFHEGEKSSAYVVVGGGFYRKVTAFTLPQIGVGYSYYYGTYEYQVNQTIENYSNNAGGVNGGIGFTYKPSRFAGERFFAEARYVEVFNSASANSVASDYPPSNARTGYFPVTVGIRF